MARLMLFGDLKGGGNLTITVNNSELALVAKPKVARLPLLAVETVESDTSNEGN
jgi:hypothetical protein